MVALINKSTKIILFFPKTIKFKVKCLNLIEEPNVLHLNCISVFHDCF